MTFILRPYQPDQDGPEIFELYQATLGDRWPLRYDLFRKVTTDHAFYRPGDHFVAGASGRLVGFAATQILRPEPVPNAMGGLEMIFVSPSYRRQGVGRALHNAALDRLRKTGMRSIRLGGGGLLRLWPGIPDDCNESQAFFKKMGWRNFSRCCDLVRDVRSYQVPEDLIQRMSASGIDLHPASMDEMPAILAFEHSQFPGWYREYAYKTALGEQDEILVAWQEGKGVVGSLMMFSPHSRLLSVNLVWKELLGEEVGGMGAVGVLESERGRGIGQALVAWGTEVLQQRGVGNAMIDWTGLVDFYGKVGYKPWRWYTASEREL
jgi:GNAT superfamily N-acetyltransferase